MILPRLKNWPLILMLPVAMLSLNAHAENENRILDLPYGTALYQLFQNKTLDAITEIDVGKIRNRLNLQPDDGELLRGSLYFSYGLVDESERIFNQLLEQKKPQSTQDRIWFNLARVQFEQGGFKQAEQLLARIANPLPEHREQQRQYLLTALYTRNQNFTQASEAIQKIQPSSIWRAYALYNLSVAQISSGQPEAGYQGLADLEKLQIPGDEFAGLLDASYLALGLNSLRHEENDQAIEYFLKVRFSGPISNKALLGIGWAWSQKSDLERAMSYWKALQNKTQIDAATLESYLAIPYALEQKQRKAQAVEYYRMAAANYDRLLDEQENLISQITEDQLIDALIQNRIIEDSSIRQLTQTGLEKNTPNYLYTLIADERFHQQLRQYQELLDILNALLGWSEDIPVLSTLLNERRNTFEAKRPVIENTAELNHVNELREQVEEMSTQVDAIITNERYLALANSEEMDYLQQLEELKTLIDQLQTAQDLSAEKDKYRLLNGLLQYQIETDFPTRSWHVRSELKSLQQSMQSSSDAAQSLGVSAIENDRTLKELDQRIAGQSTLINQLLTQVDQLLGRQKNQINQFAIYALSQQQQHIRQLRLSARYSLARLYDDLSSSEEKND